MTPTTRPGHENPPQDADKRRKLMAHMDDKKAARPEAQPEPMRARIDWERRRWDAAMAALPQAVEDYGQPKIGEGSQQRRDRGNPVLPYATAATGTREQIIARQAYRYADALIAASKERADG